MDANKLYKFIGFGAMDATKPYEIHEVLGPWMLSNLINSHDLEPWMLPNRINS